MSCHSRLLLYPIAVTLVGIGDPVSIVSLIPHAVRAAANVSLLSGHVPARVAAQSDNVPRQLGWVRPLVLAILWMFIAAILVGPVVKFVRNTAANMQRR